MIKLQLNPEPRILGQFAWVSLFAFPLIAWLFHAQFGLPDAWTYGIAALGPVTLVTHLIGLRIVPLFVFRGLVIITFPIGFVVFPVIIGLVYYGVFTPMGVGMRLFGRDVMGMKPDKSIKSYWHERGAPRPASSYFKLY